MLFLKLVHTEFQLNHKTQLFWVKAVHLVPNDVIPSGGGEGMV